MKLLRSLRPAYRLAVVAALLGTILLTEITVTSGLIAAMENGDPPCDYTTYLQEPEPRARFIALRQQMHEITQRMASPELRYQFENAIPANKPKRTIDEASNRCLGCHDEDGRVKRYGSTPAPLFDNSGMSKMTQAHPVGLLYERRTLANAYLHSSARFPLNMVLIYGRLSCITCHDPLNQEGNHLAEKNRGALCFACHDL